jgi:hypothetical protein
MALVAANIDVRRGEMVVAGCTTFALDQSAVGVSAIFWFNVRDSTLASHSWYEIGGKLKMNRMKLIVCFFTGCIRPTFSRGRSSPFHVVQTACMSVKSQ